MGQPCEAYEAEGLREGLRFATVCWFLVVECAGSWLASRLSVGVGPGEGRGGGGAWGAWTPQFPTLLDSRRHLRHLAAQPPGSCATPSLKNGRIHYPWQWEVP